MPIFLSTDIKNYNYAANLVYDELIDKYGTKGIPKDLNINRIRKAIEYSKNKGLSPKDAAEKVYQAAERVIAKRRKLLSRNVSTGKKDFISADKQQITGKNKPENKSKKIVKKTNFSKSVDSSKYLVSKRTTQTPPKSMKYLKKGGGAVIIATLAIYAAYSIYKRYLANANRYCSNKVGKERDKCINLFKNRARKEQIKKLKESLQSCNKTKNPEKCRKIILIKIKKLEMN